MIGSQVHLTQDSHLAKEDFMQQSLTVPRTINPFPILKGAWIRREFEELRRQIQLDMEKGLPTCEEAVELDNCNLRGFDFAKEYTSTYLDNCAFIDCDLCLSDLSRFSLRWSRFLDSSLIGANLSNSNVDFSLFQDADIRWTQLKRASFYGADMRGVKMAGADVTGADFSGCDLTNADLRGIIARNASFTGAVLHGTNFSGADLSGAMMSGSDLNDTLFFFAKMDADRFHPIDFTKGNYYGVKRNGESPLDWPAIPPADISSLKAEIDEIRWYSGRKSRIKKYVRQHVEMRQNQG